MEGGNNHAHRAYKVPQKPKIAPKRPMKPKKPTKAPKRPVPHHLRKDVKNSRNVPMMPANYDGPIAQFQVREDAPVGFNPHAVKNAQNVPFEPEGYDPQADGPMQYRVG